MILITLVLGLIVAGLLYVVMIWNYDYWRKRQVPGPRPNFLTGNYPNLFSMKQNVIYDLKDIYVKYKNKYDAVGIFSGRLPQLLVLSPELARRIFVANFKNFHDNQISQLTDAKTDFIFTNNPFAAAGEKWKQRRADITAGLTMSRIKTVYPVTNKVCQQLSEWVKKQIRLGAADGIDGKDMSLCFTSEMVTDCVLGLSAGSFSDKPTPIMANTKELFTPRWSFLILFSLVNTFPMLLRFFKLRFIPPHLAKFFTDLMDTALQTRKSQQSSDGKAIERSDFLDYVIKLGERKNLSTHNLLPIAITFLLDGFETSASVLSHMLMLLGRNPEIQQKLREEIQAHLKEGLIPFEKLSELPYLEACLLGKLSLIKNNYLYNIQFILFVETIRLFPPGFMTSKICTESVELPNREGPNFTVEKGTVVVIPHSCHMMDEEFFPDPEAYKPERFLDPNDAKMYRERGMFMAFGDGPRICLGMRFATTQIKAAIVELITKFNVKVNPKTRKDILFDPTFFQATLEGGIWLDMQEI
ncbi:hypothetical protein KR018_002533 [Drosophila ironensis]|nr:hypothetical protein KR018_002533 [Drosophila ironensis]